MVQIGYICHNFFKKALKAIIQIPVPDSVRVFHNFGQIIAASFMLQTINVVAYLPVLIVSGVITEVLVGFAVKYSLPYVRRFS